MSLVTALAVIGIVMVLLALLCAVGLRALGLGRELAALDAAHAAIEDEVEATHAKLATTAQETKKLEGWLDAAEQENAWLLDELKKRPAVTRKVHKIFAFGVKGTGKTSLTLKWANPLVHLGSIEATTKARYERVVSRARVLDGIAEHVFEVHDFGGDQMVDALAALVGEEVHGLLFVVDVNSSGRQGVDMERVKQQLAAFQPPAFQYFLGPKTIAACKSVILFINKGDLIASSPSIAEETAKTAYGALIDDLCRYSHLVDVRVVVGSARYGHSTDIVFSHFMEKLLPQHARDHTLLQYVKEPGDATVMTTLIDSSAINGPGDTEPLGPLRKESQPGPPQTS